jgi:FtsZ-interacting cell division protein ZipA
MSDLQLSLIVVGLLVIAGVYLFNRMQEQRYRRKFEEVAERVPDEAPPAEESTPFAAVDLEAEVEAEVEAEEAPRIEPSFTGAADTAETDLPSISQEPRLREPGAGDMPAATTTAPAREPSARAPEIDYRAEFVGGAPITGDMRVRLEKQLAGIGKPIRVEGRDGPEGPWVLSDPGLEPTGPMRIALQLADRGGPVSAAQLARFREIVENVAAEVGATVEFDDEAVALAQAAALDGFCADNDVAIGLNIIPGDVTGLSGTKLRALAESSGFTLTADGAFHLQDDRGATLIALASMDGVPFEASSLKHLRSQGVTLLIDVARVMEGRQTFRRMTELAKQFAHALNGTVADDKRTPLNAASLEKIAGQIDAIQGALKARGIVPGSPLALRLFS